MTKVRFWNETDVLDSWEPVYIGDLEPLLTIVGTITFTSEGGDGYIAWGGGAEEIFEAIQHIPRELWHKELAVMVNDSVIVWESVQEFHSACVRVGLNLADEALEFVVELLEDEDEQSAV